MLRWVTVCLVVGVLSGPASGADAHLERLNRGPHGEPLEVPGGGSAEGVFELPAGAVADAHLFVQAIMRYRAVSEAGGLLRIAVNGEMLAGEDCINRPDRWQEHGRRAYVGQAFSLPAQPAFAASDRAAEGGLGLLFDITRLVRPGVNRVRFTHAAATEPLLLRDATVVSGETDLALGLVAVPAEANDPARLEWSFAPHIQENRGMFIAPGAPNRVSFFARNTDSRLATELGLELQLPPHVSVRAVYIPYRDGWTDRTRVEEQPGDDAARRRVRILLPPEATLPGSMTDFTTFGGHPLQVYFSCDAPASSQTVHWRSLSHGGVGDLHSAPLTILPEVAKSPQPRRSLLGTWAYRVLWRGVSNNEKQFQAQMRETTNAYLAHCGISRLVLADADEIPSAKAHNMLVSLASPWSFNRTVYPHDTTELDKARRDAGNEPITADTRRGTFLWCPTYAATHDAEVFEPISERLRAEGWDGFDLDHEGVHAPCFCARCKAAFVDTLAPGEPAPEWPAAVQPDGPLHERWLQFHTRNVGRHVEAIRQAVKRGNPRATLFSWFVASLHEHHPDGDHAETYRKRLLHERRIGYDIHHFMEHLDVANMANGVYPHDDTTWTQPYGLTWAFNRVEAMVDNPWNVPLAPCLNIGFGSHGRDTWTAFAYLRWQAKTHVAQGVKGLDFWMLPFYDARHYALFAELAQIFAATQDIVWDGVRADERIVVRGPDAVFSRAFLGHGKLLLGLSNRSNEPVTVRLELPEQAGQGRLVPGNAPLRDSELHIPPLDGVFAVFDLP